MNDAGRLLIADDEITFSSATADLLRRAGYVVNCAADAEAALRLLARDRFDLVIADIQMPGNASFEFVRQLPRLVGDAPVIIVTGYPSVATALDAIQLSLVGYHVKPFEFGDLLANVEGAIARRRGAAQSRAALDQLRRLTARLHQTQEAERSQLAREIHDELGQALTCIKMELSWLRQHLSLDRQKLEAQIDAVVELADQAVDSVRKVSTELRPSVLDRFGIQAAIEWKLQEFRRRTHDRCQVVAELEEIELDAARSTALFRIVQEALTNILRHAAAHRVTVSLRRQAADEVVLAVADDGAGLPPAALLKPTSLGLVGMRERARAFGGDVTIQGESGKGTQLTARIPLGDQ